MEFVSACHNNTFYILIPKYTESHKTSAQATINSSWSLAVIYKKENTYGFFKIYI